MHHAELPAGRHGLQSGAVRLRLSRKRPVLPGQLIIPFIVVILLDVDSYFYYNRFILYTIVDRKVT